MSPSLRLCLVLALAGLVQGCQLSLPGGGSGQEGDVTANAVAGAPIEVTALDDPAGAPAGPGADTAGAASAAAQATMPDADGGDAAVPAPVPGAEAALPGDAPAEAGVDPAAGAEVAPAVVEPPKSEAQLACERRKGRWSPVGSGILRTCIFETKDGGKQCDRESDCEGACLARSGTCAPIRPLLGCHDVLQDNGVRVTQCID